MAVCHALKKVVKENPSTGVEEAVFLGNMIDRKMFESISNEFDLLPGHGTTQDVVMNMKTKERFAIMKQFDFDNKRKVRPFSFLYLLLMILSFLSSFFLLVTFHL
jgi:hypothetical protein